MKTLYECLNRIAENKKELEKSSFAYHPDNDKYYKAIEKNLKDLKKLKVKEIKAGIYCNRDRSALIEIAHIRKNRLSYRSSLSIINLKHQGFIELPKEDICNLFHDFCFKY